MSAELVAQLRWVGAPREHPGGAEHYLGPIHALHNEEGRFRCYLAPTGSRSAKEEG